MFYVLKFVYIMFCKLHLTFSYELQNIAARLCLATLRQWWCVVTASRCSASQQVARPASPRDAPSAARVIKSFFFLKPPLIPVLALVLFLVCFEFLALGYEILGLVNM
jgi:hypothetical protein